RPLILIEAKRRFGKVADGRPVISNECLAQMTCEALSARLESPESPEKYRPSSFCYFSSSTLPFFYPTQHFLSIPALHLSYPESEPLMLHQRRCHQLCPSIYVFCQF